MTDFVYSGM